MTFPRLPDCEYAYALVERDDGVRYRLYGGTAGPQLPHDIRHLIAERELGITDGIWAGIAAGVVLASMQHVSGRPPPHAAEVSQQLITQFAGPWLRAELLANLVESVAALDRPTAPQIRRLAKIKKIKLPDAGDAGLDPAAISAAATALQVEAARWARLRIGEELCYDWRMDTRPDGDARPDEVISRGDVTLRRYRADDLDALLQAVTDSVDHLRPWMPWAAGYDRAAAAEFLAKTAQEWADGTAYNYAITTGGVLAGGCGLMARIGPGGLEIGYWVHRAYTRRGLAMAASAALVEQAFRRPDIERVEIVHDELNIASGGVPRKLGFTEVGRRAIDPPSDAGTGVGVVWRLVR